MGTRVSYPVEIKWKAIEMRVADVPVKEVMLQLNIRNRAQLKTWMRWYKNGEMHRFEQPVGKQYSYGKGPRISTILGTLAFLFNNERLKALRPQIQFGDETLLLEMRLTGTFKLWSNSYAGHYFRGLTGAKKQNALAIYAFLIISPSIVECYNESMNKQEWSPQLKIDFVKRLGSMIRQRVDAELMRIEQESKGYMELDTIFEDEEDPEIDEFDE